MYSHPVSYSHHRRPGSRGSYFLPFFSIIIFGLITVLIFQIFGYFQEKRQQALENKAAVSVVAGRAEMKIWGVPDWTSALSGSILHEGDSLRTQPGSRVVMTLLNGSVVRLDAETEIEMTGLKSRDGQDEIAIFLRKGALWLKRSPQPSVRASLEVATDHLHVSSTGTIFSVEKAKRESVHVLDGTVMVSVRVEEPGSEDVRVVESLEVALGQEISLSSSDVIDLQNKKPIPLLALLSDEFRDGEWYDWNRSEDVVSTTVVTVQDAVKGKEDAEASLAAASQMEEPPPVQVSAETPVLTPPVIELPKEGERTTTGKAILVSGTVSAATEKVEVATHQGGKTEGYSLQKYKAGSTRWSYVASPEYGNLVPGENRITVTAIGKDGSRSAGIDIVIVLDRPKEPADLSAPVVSSYNGGVSAETTENSMKVEGTIGKGIHKIFVNDFALTQYVPDSGKWMYYAKTVYGNLRDGMNEYSVYGIDYEGKKTPVTKFSITKKAAPAAPVSSGDQPMSPVPSSAPERDPAL